MERSKDICGVGYFCRFRIPSCESCRRRFCRTKCGGYSESSERLQNQYMALLILSSDFFFHGAISNFFFSNLPFLYILLVKHWRSRCKAEEEHLARREQEAMFANKKDDRERSNLRPSSRERPPKEKKSRLYYHEFTQFKYPCNWIVIHTSLTYIE